MKHIIGFSGGVASAVCGHIIAMKYQNKITHEAILLFHDTKSEDKDNHRFRKQAAERIGLPITEFSDGRDIWKIFDDCGFLGNGRNTMCSRILKQEMSIKYLKENQPAILYIGFTIEEWRRAQRTAARYAQKGIEVKFPLIENKIGKEECTHRVLNCWGLKLPRVYDFLDHANCIPCIKGKKAYWGLIYMFRQDKWQKASNAEKKFKHTIFTEAGSLEEELDNCLKLAKKYLKKRKANEDQQSLIEFPCECSL